MKVISWLVFSSPVIVDYFSHGCGPCRQIAPHYKQLAKQYKGRAVFAKVDVNYNRETSSRQQIRSMPTFQFYINKEKKDEITGANKENLVKSIKKNILNTI